MDRPKKKIITVEANIAAGKTTLMELIEEFFGKTCCVMQEPVEEWRKIGLFQEYLKDAAKYATIFQLFVLITRMKIIHDALNADDGKNVIIIERSFLFDVDCFIRANVEFGSINNIEHRALLASYEILRDKIYNLADIGGIIYINTDIETCIHRMSVRGRDTEKDSYRDRYMSLLDTYHKEALDKFSGRKLVIDGSVNYLVQGDGRKEIVKKIDEFIGAVSNQ